MPKRILIFKKIKIMFKQSFYLYTLLCLLPVIAYPLDDKATSTNKSNEYFFKKNGIEKIILDLLKKYSKLNLQEIIWNLRNDGKILEAQKLENFVIYYLTNGEIISHEMIAVGMTAPRLVSYKNSVQGVFKWNNLTWGRASYKAEIAAFILDRLLNLNIVPITAPRSYVSKNGSVQFYMKGYKTSNGSTKKQVNKKLKFFDFLIANSDRGYNNYLTKPGTNIVVAIDHGKAFATDELTESLYEEIENIDAVTPPSEVYERLKSISNNDFYNALKIVLSKKEIDGFLRRKEILIQAIESSTKSKIKNK